MTSRRVYRDSLSIDKVISEFEKNKGTQFDPEIAKAFLNIIESKRDEIERIMKI